MTNRKPWKGPYSPQHSRSSSSRQRPPTAISKKPRPLAGADNQEKVTVSSTRRSAPSTPRVPARRPNILIFIVDEERFPAVYENASLRSWQKSNLVAQELLRDHGIEFKRHYVGSAACAPSRATFFTGQYPSLHGVTQTPGGAKHDFDPDVFWLDPNSVPTMGDYFEALGYRTFLKGKWHASQADLLVPGTKDPLISYNARTGIPEPEKEHHYLGADRLGPFGFHGWIGPEPFDQSPRNSGSSAAFGTSGRDVAFADDTVRLLQALDAEQAAQPHAEAAPWLIVSSFVNPHDITLYGEVMRLNPLFNFEVDPTVPDIPPAPTANESLDTKPMAQRSYREVFPRTFQPTRDTLFYRQLYYSLQKKADQEMLKVFNALRQSHFYEDTVVLFTSDHGDLLGAHGGLFQKWYQAYEEAIHVPLIVHNPRLFPNRSATEMLTSHVDVLPTLLGLVGADVNAIQGHLRRNHNEVHPLVGRDLSALFRGIGVPERAEEPIYFMTDDHVTKGLHQVSFLGIPYNAVVQPNHIETVIAALHTGTKQEIWKYSRYYDNPQFWSVPGIKDVVVHQSDPLPISPSVEGSLCISTTRTLPVPDEFELYNLTADPLEVRNLASPLFATRESRVIQDILAKLLEEQCIKKRLSPSSGKVPGMPSCSRNG